MNQSEIQTIADKWFAAFNAHNLENLLSLYDDDAEHFSPKLKIRMPETGGFVRGKDALRVWWKDSFDRLPDLQYIPTSFIDNGKSIFMEYKRIVGGEPDMMVGEVLEIHNGLIIRSRVYHG